jgi:hypothetical protein
MRPVVFFATPVALSAHQNFPVFDCPTRLRPFHAALPPARREAYDHTARLFLVFALLAEQRRAAHALWSGGVPVPRSAATLGPRNLSKSPENISKWEDTGNAEQAWYDAIQARLCLAVLDLIIIRRCRDP